MKGGAMGGEQKADQEVWEVFPTREDHDNWKHILSRRGRAELERRGVTEAQIDALLKELKRDEEPEV